MDKEVNRQVTVDEGVNFASKHGFDFFEISSTQRVNVDEVFVKLCPRIKEIHEVPIIPINKQGGNKTGCKTQ
jgi:hypothetical protein